MSASFFSDKKFSLSVTLLIIIIGSIFYFSIELDNVMGNEDNKNSIYDDIIIKTAYIDDEQLKIFAQNRNNIMAKLEIVEGNPIPERDSIVLGNVIAENMKNEGLFNKTGDIIEGFFGKNVKVEGILIKTNTPLDYFHFVDLQRLSVIEGDYRLFIKNNEENLLKLFYYLEVNEKPKFDIKLTEGNFTNYNQIHNIVDEKYYPMILGNIEAENMKNEGLFNKTGDIIEGFFGKNVIIVGIIEKTNSSLDIMHIVPIAKEEFS